MSDTEPADQRVTVAPITVPRYSPPGWKVKFEKFSRFINPTNNLLAVLLTIVSYAVGRKSTSAWALAAIVAIGLGVSLILNWIREEISGSPEERLSKIVAPVIADSLIAPLSESMSAALALAANPLNSGITRLQEAVDAGALGGPLAEQLGFQGLTYPTRTDTPSVGGCFQSSTSIETVWVMGLQANRWMRYGTDQADEIGRQMKRFIERTLLPTGRVRFLLLDPDGDQIKLLRGEGGEAIARPESTDALQELASKHSQVQIRYYDEIPRFRIIRRDSVLVVSCYSLTGSGQFRTKSGADAPHLTFEAVRGEGCWPLFDAFTAYYEEIWERSRDPLDSDGSEAGKVA